MRSMKSAKGKFDAFLAYMRRADPTLHPYDHYFVDIPCEYFTPELLGHFADYMIGVCNLKWDTINSYLSRVKNMICEDYPNESHVRLNFKGKQEWFASVRKNLKAKCNDRCLLTGTKLQQGSPPMTTDDLELLCQMLFKKNRSFLSHYSQQVVYVLSVTKWKQFVRSTETHAEH